MKMLITVLAAGLTLTFAELGLGASEAEAASFCKHRYNLCLARCPGPFARCSSRCQARYRVHLSRARYSRAAVAVRGLPGYFIVIASPLRSAFAISPTCRPESSRTAPFWLVSTIARTPPPTASPAPAAA